MDVPAGAKFTDTTYSEITTAEIDAGTASTLRTITGRRVKYILDKVQGWITALTKVDVGLGNVDNVKQATKTEFDTHNGDNTRHITAAERAGWNAKEPAISKNTAFNKNFETTASNIKMNGTPSVGSLSTVARADHVHPVDTSRAAASHTHTKSQVTDMPTKLSQFENDIGAGAGLNIVCSPTQPSLNPGDWWYKEL